MPPHPLPLALVVNELASERKRVLSASIAINPDELEIDRLSTTGVDTKEMDVSSEDGLICGGEDGSSNLMIPIDPVRICSSLIDRKWNNGGIHWVGKGS